MNFTDKLQRLTKGKNKAELARTVGLRGSVFSIYITKGYAPRADIALKMARALNVPLDWLVDDSQDWPSPPVLSAASLATPQLTEELGRRLHAVGCSLLAKLFQALHVDWIATAEELIIADFESNLPKKYADLGNLVGQIEALFADLDSFDPCCKVGDMATPELLKVVKPEFEITLLDLYRYYRNLKEKPGFSATMEFLGIEGVGHLLESRPDWKPPWHKEHIKFRRAIAEAELKSAKQSLKIRETALGKSPKKPRDGK